MIPHGRHLIILSGRILIYRPGGEWNLEMVEQAKPAVEQAVEPLLGKPWASLIDARRWELAGPETISGIQEINRQIEKIGLTHEATVVSSELNLEIHKELQSVYTAVQTALFFDLSSAIEWLLAAGYPLGEVDPRDL